MHNEYKREMEKLGPRQEELERLYTMIEGGTPRKRTKRLGRRAAAAILACAALAVTAAAAGPTVWEALQAQLGAFAPYAVPTEGTVIDQDIEIALVGSISDNYTARVYFTATDLAGGRFTDHTAINARLKGAGMTGGSGCQILSYDEAKNQFLVEAAIDGMDANQPVTLELSSFNPGYHYIHANFRPPQSAAILNSTMTEDGVTVLLPNQTPMTNPDCEGVFISSMGFDANGLFHVRIAWEEGYSSNENFLSVMPESKSSPNQAIYQENGSRTLVEDGVDYQFPNLTADRLDDLDYVQIYGLYQGPEEVIKGSWSIPVTLEQADQLEITVDRPLGSFQVNRVVVSPLTVAIFHTRLNGETGFLTWAQVIQKDGTEAKLAISFAAAIENDESGAYSLGYFEEPIRLEDISSLRLMGEEVWTNPNP